MKSATVCKKTWCSAPVYSMPSLSSHFRRIQLSDRTRASRQSSQVGSKRKGRSISTGPLWLGVAVVTLGSYDCGISLQEPPNSFKSDGPRTIRRLDEGHGNSTPEQMCFPDYNYVDVGKLTQNVVELKHFIRITATKQF